jgi:hypothetical protein
MSEWINIKDKKPEEHCTCYVMNCKEGGGCFITLYDVGRNTFRLYDPKMYDHPCLEVTHYIVLPYMFIDEDW